MKNTLRTLSAAVLLGTAPLAIQQVRAQTAVESTTTVTPSMGTITEFSPDILTIRTDSATTPMAYHYTKTTTYVDESGNPVSMETVKSGLPVTVYYTKDGDDMVASKVVVRKTTTTAPAAIEEQHTTTTTTTSQQ